MRVSTADIAKLVADTVGALPGHMEVVRHHPDAFLLTFIHVQAGERGGGGRVLGCGGLVAGARSAGARARPPSGTATAAVPVHPCTTPVPPHPSRIPPRHPHRESHHRRPPPCSAPAGRPRTSWFHAVAERPRSSCSSRPQGRDPPARRAAAGRPKLLLSALPLGGCEAPVIRAAKVVTLLLAAPPPGGREVLLAASPPGGREAFARSAAKVASLVLAVQPPGGSAPAVPTPSPEAGPAVPHVSIRRPSTSCLMLLYWLGTPGPLVLPAITVMAEDGWCFSPPLSSFCPLCFLSK
ncbi:uncharacterized protein [Lolium perenne]|uniref:uncharacterized protein n=1 Tax=Lolium perenne TaxID=4522 RepID=UPI003A99072E